MIVTFWNKRKMGKICLFILRNQTIIKFNTVAIYRVRYDARNCRCYINNADGLCPQEVCRVIRHV